MQRKLTNQLLGAAGAVVIGGLLSAAPVLAQVPAQPIPLVRVDVNKMASGYRSSVIVDSPVVNEHGEKIGMVDDLIIEPSEMVPYAILSVGGFVSIWRALGGGTVPKSQDQRDQNRAAGRHEGSTRGYARVQLPNEVTHGHFGLSG